MGSNSNIHDIALRKSIFRTVLTVISTLTGLFGFLYIKNDSFFGYYLLLASIINWTLIIWNIKKVKSINLHVWILCIELLLLFPIGWFSLAGLEGSAPFAFLMFCTILMSLLPAKYSYTIVSLFLLELIVLIIFSSYHPELVKPYPSEEARFQDKVAISIAALIALGLLFRSYISKNEKKNSQLLESTLKLEQKNNEYLAAEEELRASNDSLLETLNELQRSRNEKDKLEFEKQIAEDLAVYRKSFLAKMSHEIRTPLTAIIGNIDLLKDNSSLDFDTKNQIEMISSSSTILMTVINDILNLSKLESGQESNSPIKFMIKNELDQCISLFKSKANEKGLKLHLDIDDSLEDEIVLDGFKFIQIVNNLLSNALKFTEKGEVNIKLEKLFSQKIKLTVQDTGRGIRADKIEDVFIDYRQNKNTDQLEGTGLGMPIVKKLCSILDGSISVDSTLGMGSTFTVEVPYLINKDESIESTSEKKNLKLLKKGDQVLIVDDVKINTTVAKMMLESIGLKADTSLSGKEALSKLEEKQFDHILLDIEMPEMNGVDTLHEIQKKGFDVTVIAFTANAMEGDEEHYKNIGFNHYLTKPLSLNTLKSMLID